MYFFQSEVEKAKRFGKKEKRLVGHGGRILKKERIAEEKINSKKNLSGRSPLAPRLPHLGHIWMIWYTFCW
jgi:hypothetical protein